MLDWFGVNDVDGSAYCCRGSVLSLSVLCMAHCVRADSHSVHILLGGQHLQPARSPKDWSLQRADCYIQVSLLT